MIEPLVSIVIPVFNGANYLACAIESALSQTYPHCETIVVNDGSTDNGETERIALSYGARIRYFSKSNGGVATALNLGIQMMQGEYFCWLSHDDFYHPDKVLHELQAIPPQHPETIIYSDYVYYDTVTGHSLPFIMEKWFTKQQLSTPLFPVVFQLIHGCATMIHRSHFDRVGLFDESQLVTQDYDMWFRVFRNTRVQHCPNCDMTSRLHPAAGNQTMPQFINDACAFFIRMDQMLTDAERAQLFGTPHRYYQQMHAFLAGTKYAAAKRHFAAFADGDPYGYHCSDTEQKENLLQTIQSNITLTKQIDAGSQNGNCDSEKSLDEQIHMAMEQFYSMPEHRQIKYLRRPTWRLRTRVKRALLRYGIAGTLRLGIEKIAARLRGG